MILSPTRTSFIQSINTYNVKKTKQTTFVGILQLEVAVIGDVEWREQLLLQYIK